MENKNTIFDTWMEAQNKMTKNMVEMNEKLQKTMTGGEMMEKGSELYKEWLEKQKGLLNNLMGQEATTANGETSETNGKTLNPADFYKNWMNVQNEASEKMLEMNRAFYDNLMKAQTGATAAWGNPQSLQDNWMNGFNTVFSGMNKAMTDMPKFMNPNTAKDAFENMMKSTQTYAKMYEMWQPLLQNMPKGGFDAEAMKKMFDPAAYKTIIDKLFGFTPNGNMTQLFEQSSKMISNWYSTSRQMGDSMLNTFGKERDLMEGMMPFGQSYVTEMYKNMYNGFRQNMMPFFRLSSPGKEQEQLDKMFEMQEKMVNYSIKQNEMQYLIYGNAATAMTEVMNVLKARTDEGKEYSNFQEFYGEWAAINEKIFIQLFSTEEFSRLQGQLISLGLDLKKGLEEQMESILEPFPVVLKSHMDEVHRNNYELRKELRNLQKTVKEMQRTMATAPKENATPEASKTVPAKPAAKK
ncbi:MAG TPA: poly(R)-hydroxyalkanoic acid synthase subunit PhaE [Adhaeribacter sp.]|nr:poly(R)-hydroxyalkanoic acid synthase subunit PhaE [Adhaeribacter sp.]